MSLLEHGFEVTLLAARTPDEIRAGRVASTQCMFHTALQHERDRGLDLWQAPDIGALQLTLGGSDGARALEWTGELSRGAKSVDQRVKMAGWLELFARRGGVVHYGTADVSTLDDLAAEHDLALVAGGTGDIAGLFPRDANRSVHTEPQRALSIAYVRGAAGSPGERAEARFSIVPGVGEMFVIPARTLSGECEIPFFEGIPGGPLDCWQDRPAADEHWSRMLELMRRHIPWEHERFVDAEPTDPLAVLSGAVTPVVREPVAHLPSGRAVLGMGDVVVTNDPITGQGSNNAGKCAQSYVDSILQRGEKPFDEQWMRQTFERFWDYARHVTAWTNAALQPPPPHVFELFTAAAEHPRIRNRFADAFDDPADLAEWFLDPDGARDYLAELAAG